VERATRAPIENIAYDIVRHLPKSPKWRRAALLPPLPLRLPLIFAPASPQTASVRLESCLIENRKKKSNGSHKPYACAAAPPVFSSPVFFFLAISSFAFNSASS
jgi:hypothetical protein